MGSLLTETPHSEITATMEVLALWGVEREDLKAYRGAATVVQERIAEAFMACKRGEKEALAALACAQSADATVVEWPVCEDAARAIMGKNMFGLADAMKHFAVKPTKKDLVALANIPYSEKVLRECATTHVLVADFGLSVMDIWKQHSKLFCSKDAPWYGNSEQTKWARKRVKPAWRLLRKTAVIDSFSKSYAVQQKLLSEVEETPEAREMVYLAIGYYLVTGEKLFPNFYVRTASLSGGGSRIYFGYFLAVGLNFGSYWDDDSRNSVGLASARLPTEAHKSEGGE